MQWPARKTKLTPLFIPGHSKNTTYPVLNKAKTDSRYRRFLLYIL